MLYNPLLAHQIAKERLQDIMREARRAHLIRVTVDSKNNRVWQIPNALILRSLVALFTRS